MSWPSINTMAAYRGYDFQGGEHAAHSLENLWFNLKTNVEVMLNLKADTSFGGILENPFYTSFTVLLLASTVWLLFRMVYSRRYVRGFVLGISFCIQIFVILLNVSGTFTIDINQRYVLVALPLFALLMALGPYDALCFFSKMKPDGIGRLVLGIAVAMSLGLMMFHAPSYKANMLYYKNKLLAEEDFLNTELKKYPENSIYIYARPWQMLASGHSAFSERTFKRWDTDTFAKWYQVSGGNIYLVRGQDGYGSVNRQSRVVGFKTTDQIDEILDSYKNERVLLEPKLFGYPLVIYRIDAKKGVSQYAQRFSVSNMDSSLVTLNKNFEESIACSYSVNGKPEKEKVVTEIQDSLLLDSTDLSAGMNRLKMWCLMPDADTLTLYRDLFMEGEGVALVSEMPMKNFHQDWGNPQKDQTVDHNGITLDKEPFRYGIGSHADAVLEYDIAGQFNMLHGVIGLDDESACGDGAFFVVKGDGRELFRSNKMYSTQKQILEVDVSGVQNLQLVLEQGGNKDCDHGDWANAWLEAR